MRIQLAEAIRATNDTPFSVKKGLDKLATGVYNRDTSGDGPAMIPSDDIEPIRKDLIGLVECVCAALAERDYKTACRNIENLNHASVLLMNAVFALHAMEWARENVQHETSPLPEDSVAIKAGIQEVIDRICGGGD